MRIILHGGYPGYWDGAGEDTALFQTLTDAAAKADGKILITLLAHEKPTDFVQLGQMLASFHAINPEIQITIASRDNFRELLPQHQILFMQGGNSKLQQQSWAEVEKEELIKNKTLIVGSSSGAMMLCNYAHSRSSGDVIKGKGVVDFAFMPHANVWPVADFVPRLQQATTSSIILLNEMQTIELNT